MQQQEQPEKRSLEVATLGMWKCFGNSKGTKLHMESTCCAKMLKNFLGGGTNVNSNW